MDFLLALTKTVNSFLWDFLLLFLLCGTGIYFTFRLKFIQLRRFPSAFKYVFGNIKLKGKKADDSGMSSFQALATAVAAQVGTGNLAGAATAIVSGGPGAVFWMWLSAFFGMATIFSEATLAQKFKSVKDGKVTGGPVYYIRAAFQGKFGKFLAAFFSVAIIAALGFMGNMVQSNSIGEAFYSAFGVSRLLVGLIVAAISAFVFIGGTKRIVSLTEKLVPIMAGFYILGCVILLIINARHIPEAFSSIFVMAFHPRSVAGGVLGVTVQKAMRYGVARGLFSNEAGMGSTPHAHALAKVKHPCDQGLVAMMGLFIDTFVILTLTALVILTTGVLGSVDAQGALITGVTLAQNAFVSSFGSFGNVFIAICMFFFAFSTIVGWYFFGETNVRYLFGGKLSKTVYATLVVCFIVIGSCLKVDLVWELSDLFNGLMVIPNLTALLALGGCVVATQKEYDLKKIAQKQGKLVE